MTDWAATPLVKVQRLKKFYRMPDGSRKAVLDIEGFHLPDGAEAALVGRSGAGKSTLLNVLTGILRPDEGILTIGDFDVIAASEPARDAFRAKNIGIIHQSFNLLQSMTAMENILVAMGFGSGRNESKAVGLLAEVGLKDKAHHKPTQLSIGQQQRVALARALANNPRLIVADEPTGSLDPESAEQALALICKITKERGATLLLVSHDPRVIERFEIRHDLGQLNRAVA